MAICKKCGKTVAEAYLTDVYNHKRPDVREEWCLDCFYAEHDYCSECGHPFPLDELSHENEVGGLLCENCSK